MSTRLRLAALCSAIAVAIPVLALAQPAPAPRPSPPPPPGDPSQSAPRAPRPSGERTYTFQLVLLAASVDGPRGFVNVPLNAQKALSDIKDFLPYKSYELLDLAWLRSSRTAEAQLAGVDGQTLSAGIDFSSSSIHGESDRIDIRRLVIVQVRELTTLSEMPAGKASKSFLPPVRPLLESSFGMRSGETVVVGTAKLDGPSKALVVLLSALP